MSKHLDTVLRAAVDQGLLTAAHAGFESQHRPWPVTVMTGIAAWLAAIPLGLLVGLMFLSGANVYGTALGLGIVFLGVAVVILRRADIPLFLEQLAIPGLIIGTCLFVFGLSDVDLVREYMGLATATAAVLLFGLAFLLPQAWLRILLGAGGSTLAALALSSHGDLLDLTISQTWRCLVIVWLLSQGVLSNLERTPLRAGTAATLEAILSGMGSMILLALAYCSGPTFMLSASLPHGFSDSFGTALPGKLNAVLSVACACGGAWWMVHRWPGLRSVPFAALAGTAMLLSWLMPSMGPVLLMVAVCVITGRRNLALLGAAAALWMVGALYYYLYWPLAHKALLLLGCGLGLGAIARFAMPGILSPLAPATEPLPQRQPQPAPALDRRWKRGLLAGAGVLTLIVVNTAIWEKEALIRTGQPVFVELAPVDPRSLMQGDYMTLNYAFPERLIAPRDGRAKLVARRAPSGIVTLLGMHEGKRLAKDEILIEVIAKHGRPLIVTDAWYFKEGEAQRWETARYGEFRVDANGKALLVGLRGPKLENL